MGKALHKLGLWMDDFTIKKKFYIFYVVCDSDKFNRNIKW